jgi:hypothetical protein
MGTRTRRTCDAGHGELGGKIQTPVGYAPPGYLAYCVRLWPALLASVPAIHLPILLKELQIRIRLRARHGQGLRDAHIDLYTGSR